MSVTWRNAGPLGQGEIITDLLNGNDDDAKLKLCGWSTTDLFALARAAERLSILARQESMRR